MLSQSLRYLFGSQAIKSSINLNLLHRTFASSAPMATTKTQNAILQPDKMSTAVIMITDHPVPTANHSVTEHLIRVHTTAITNGELLWAKNFPAPPEFTALKVLVPCNDVAGTVVTAPPSSPFQPGTEVYARSNYNRTGCAREYSILLTEEMAKRPKKFSWAESATVPMSAETAWQALFVHAGLEAKAGEGAKGKRVFITAASGGVGVWMVQLAKWAGAEVVATCGTDSVEWVKSLGADEVIDYTKTDLKEWASEEGKKVDIVRPAGVKGNIRNLFFIMASSGEDLQKVTELIEAGVVGKVALDSVHPFNKFQEAFKKLESGKTKGKVVLDLGVN